MLCFKIVWFFLLIVGFSVYSMYNYYGAVSVMPTVAHVTLSFSFIGFYQTNIKQSNRCYIISSYMHMLKFVEFPIKVHEQGSP